MASVMIMKASNVMGSAGYVTQSMTQKMRGVASLTKSGVSIEITQAQVVSLAAEFDAVEARKVAEAAAAASKAKSAAIARDLKIANDLRKAITKMA